MQKSWTTLNEELSDPQMKIKVEPLEDMKDKIIESTSKPEIEK